MSVRVLTMQQIRPWPTLWRKHSPCRRARLSTAVPGTIGNIHNNTLFIVLPLRRNHYHQAGVYLLCKDDSCKCLCQVNVAYWTCATHLMTSLHVRDGR
jgi:hypothetical protein